MRTTVTLDADVVRLLRNEAHRGGSSFKKTLNDAIRQAFRKPSPTESRKPFVVRAMAMGLRPGIDPTRLSDLADEMETDAFIDLTKRLLKKTK